MSKSEQEEHILAAPCLETSQNRSVDSAIFTAGNWPLRAWWETFESEQLNGLIQKALEQNPSIQAVNQRIKAARQAAKIAKATLFPLVSFDADETYEFLSHNGLYKQFNPDLPINANLIDLTLSFNYEFDFWGKNRNLFESALGIQRAEEAEAKEVELITTVSLALSYFALKTNIVKQNLYKRLLEVRKKTSELSNLLKESALFSSIEPLFVEEGVWEAEQKLFVIEEEIQVNKHQINILAGRGPEEALEVDGQFGVLPDKIMIPENLSLDLLSRRPDLMAGIWRVESLAHEVGAAKADFYPNINLGAFIGLESVLYSKLLRGSSSTGGLQPAIHLPIFTAGAIRANVRAKKAAFDEAVYVYNDLLLKSTKEVSDLLVLAESIFKQKKKQDSIVGNARELFNLALLRERAGLDSLLDSLNAEESFIQKELLNADLLYGQYLASIKLTKALGGGYESSLRLPLKGGCDE